MCNLISNHTLKRNAVKLHSFKQTNAETKIAVRRKEIILSKAYVTCS